MFTSLLFLPQPPSCLLSTTFFHSSAQHVQQSHRIQKHHHLFQFRVFKKSIHLQDSPIPAISSKQHLNHLHTQFLRSLLYILYALENLVKATPPLPLLFASSILSHMVFTHLKHWSQAIRKSHFASMAPANSPLKRVRFETEEESDAVRDGTHRIAQPRGGRRTPTASSRRPLPSSMSTQKQLPGLGQTNGTASSNSGGFSFGQQQPAASQSFPPFGNAGSSSSFAPPSSSFNFGAQPSSNPFSTNSTFGGNSENSIQISAQAQTGKGVPQIPILLPPSFPPQPQERAGNTSLPDCFPVRPRKEHHKGFRIPDRAGITYSRGRSSSSTVPKSSGFAG